MLPTPESIARTPLAARRTMMPAGAPRRQAPVAPAAIACLALALAACGAPADRFGAAAPALAPAGPARPATSSRASLATPDATATAPATEAPTALPTPAPTATPAPTTAAEPVGAGADEPPREGPAAAPVAPGAAAAGADAFRLPHLTHTWQKWNNCGPSSAVMALSAFGILRDQLAAAAELKPHDRDTNVTPEELAAYLRRQGVLAVVRPGGDRRVARALLRAGAPLIAEQWIDVEGRGEMGHYRVLYGYDDAAGTVTAMDSYYGAARALAYDLLEAEWRPFAGVYVAIYLPDQSDAVRAALGPDVDEAAAWARVREGLAADADGARSGDAWTWFALGEARARAQDAAGAVAAFDRAIALGLPFRAFWYQFGYARALAETGAWERLLAWSDATVATMDGQNLEEWHVWRGTALRALGREDEARAAFERALAFHAGLPAALAALAAP